MFKQTLGLFLILLLLLVNTIRLPEAKAAAASVPLSIVVNGTLVVSDDANDTMAGENPTKNVSISVTPDLGATTATGSANMRLRTNNAAWRLTAQRTASSAGSTGILDADVSVTVTKSAGSTANAASGALVAPFTAQTNLSSIPTLTAADVVSGTAKTSSMLDNTNANNYFQVNTTYGIQPDFFYSPGTFSSTITYSLVSP